HAQERRSGCRSGGRQGHHRDARWADLGRDRAGERVEILFYGSGAGRSTSGAVMSHRILVIEDQPDNRQILRDLLTSADFEVIEAEDGSWESVCLWARRRRSP